jgi:hypothetical protein
MRKTAFRLAVFICAVFSLLAVYFQAAIQVEGNFGFATGSIEIVAPENRTYYSSTLTLSYHVHFGYASRRWIVYSLDGGGNVTIYDEYSSIESYNGSVTLSGLSSGNHIIDIYSVNGTTVVSTSGGGYEDATDRIYFYIDLSRESPTPIPSTPEPTPTPIVEPYPIWLLSVWYATIAVVAIGLFVYFKKRK